MAARLASGNGLHMSKGYLSKRYLVSSVVAVVATSLACWLVFVLNVPNPVIVLVAVMIFFTALVNNAAGAASGICIVLYALFFFSEGHSFVRFTHEGAYKCWVILVSLVAMYVLVAVIRRKSESAFEQVIDLNAKLKSQNRALKHESDHDALTGVYNRRGGDKEVAKLIGTSGQTPDPQMRAVFATMDIDNFKDINDAFGHGAGDLALQHFVGCLRTEFAVQSVLMRNGGDEFQAFLYGRSYASMALQLKQFCRRTFKLSYQGHAISFHVSCGYVAYPNQANTEKELYRKADVALYRVKTSGKHQALAYNEDMEAESSGDQQFSLRNVSENLPVSFMVYRADQGERILVVSKSLLDLCECQSFEEFSSLTGGTFHGFVYHDDLTRVEESIRRQIAASPYGLDTVDYRITTLGGRIVQVRDIGRLVHDANAGDLFYVVLYDKDTLAAEGVDELVRAGEGSVVVSSAADDGGFVGGGVAGDGTVPGDGAAGGEPTK